MQFVLQKNETLGSINTGEEQEVLEDLGLDPDKIKSSRKANDELPDFMQRFL